MTEKPSFQNILERLLDAKKDIPQSHLAYYSDLDPQGLRLFTDAWRNVKPERQLRLLDMLLARFESDTVVSYESVGRALLDDPQSEVRARALRLLAETDDPHLAEKLVEIFRNDAELAPRLEAANLLGEFILLGELGNLSEDAQKKIENALAEALGKQEPPALQKRALEALGYSSHEELAGLIEAAYERSDPSWVASALRAMGRSHDDERWREDVVSCLINEDPRIRCAAIEAAGELLIAEAGPIIIQILEDEEEDDDVTAAAIWSLSQIGGEDARVYLVNLIEATEDEEALEYLESALENLDFNEELDKFDLLDLDEDEFEADE